MTQKENKTELAKKVLQVEITKENVVALGEITALKALRAMYGFSKNPVIATLIKSLRNDLYNKNNVKHIISNAYDFAQLASGFYCEYIGKTLFDKSGIIGKHKREFTIYKACLREIDRYFRKANFVKQQTAYFHDLDEIQYKAVPEKRYAVKVAELKRVEQKIIEMKLSERESKILDGRLSGHSTMQIAKNLDIAVGSVCSCLSRIRAKASKINFMPRFA